MCPYSVFFWSVFSRIRTEYGPEKLRQLTIFAQCRRKKLPFLDIVIQNTVNGVHMDIYPKSQRTCKYLSF